MDQLLDKAQAAETEAALHFSMANDAFVLLPYRSALVLRLRGLKAVRLVCASGLSSLDRKAPYGSWVEQVVEHLLPRLKTQSRFTVKDVPPELVVAWAEYWPERVSMHLAPGPLGQPLAVVVYLMDVEWPAVADQMLSSLNRFHGLCLQLLAQRRKRIAWLGRRNDGRISLGTKVSAAVVLLAIAALFFPVRQFVISPSSMISRGSVAVTVPVECLVALVSFVKEQRVMLQICASRDGVVDTRPISLADSLRRAVMSTQLSRASF